MDRDVYDSMCKNEENHWWFSSRRLIIQKILERFVGTQSSSVLEVGCGSGGSLNMLSAYGEVSAMELDERAREAANSRGVCDVKKGRLPDDIPFENNFDLICILDVLEHIEGDLAVIKALEKKLTPSGKLLITVPAYQFLWSEHDVIHHHKRRYSRSQLEALCLKSGLHVRYFSYFNTFLFPIILAIRLMSKVLKKSSGRGINKPSGFINKTLAKIFSSERFLLPQVTFPFGVSIILVAEKAEAPP